jgi:carbonic anhydrase
MNFLSKAILLISVFIVVSCKSDIQDHWSYEGETSPEHWAEIELNTNCDGKHQSPINIIETNTVVNPTAKNLEVFYSPKTILNKVENNGHSIQFDFYPGDSIIYQHRPYYLKQIHFHEPAEHMLNGVIYPIEIHLVHLSKDKDITVLGILGMEGEESQLFEFMESFLPLKNGEEKIINKRLDLTDLFPDVTDFYSYDGSLTTPPCTENVKWVVFKNPIFLSLEEVLELKNNMPLNNYRNEQPINDRIIYHNLELQ